MKYANQQFISKSDFNIIRFLRRVNTIFLLGQLGIKFDHWNKTKVKVVISL